MLFSLGAVETVKYEMVNLVSCLYELGGLHYGCQIEKEETVFMLSLFKALMSQTNLMQQKNKSSYYKALGII